MTSLTIRLPAELAAAAHAVAAARRVSLAALIREALAQHIDAQTLAEPLRREIAAEASTAAQAIRSAGRELYERAADLLAEMAEERNQIADMLREVIGLPPSTPTPVAPTQPTAAHQRAPGTAPR